VFLNRRCVSASPSDEVTPFAAMSNERPVNHASTDASEVDPTNHHQRSILTKHIARFPHDYCTGDQSHDFI
jgi:hypothetical protein